MAASTAGKGPHCLAHPGAPFEPVEHQPIPVSALGPNAAANQYSDPAPDLDPDLDCITFPVLMDLGGMSTEFVWREMPQQLTHDQDVQLSFNTLHSQSPKGYREPSSGITIDQDSDPTEPLTALSVPLGCVTSTERFFPVVSPSCLEGSSSAASGTGSGE